MLCIGRLGNCNLLVYSRLENSPLHTEQERSMSDQTDDQDDGVADSIAAVAIISVVILTLYIWLSGMPS